MGTTLATAINLRLSTFECLIIYTNFTHVLVVLEPLQLDGIGILALPLNLVHSPSKHTTPTHCYSLSHSNIS